MPIKLLALASLPFVLTGCFGSSAQPPQGDWIEKRVSGERLTYIHATQSPKDNSVYLDALNHCTVRDKRLTPQTKRKGAEGNYTSKFVCQ